MITDQQDFFLGMVCLVGILALSFGIVGGSFSVACSMEMRFTKGVYYMNYVIFLIAST